MVSDRPPAPGRAPLGRWQWALLGALIGVAAALRFPTLDQQSLWSDEAATVEVIRLPLGRMLDQVAETQATPPLYYVLAWAWVHLFGSGEWGLRSLSAMLGVATVPVSFAAARQLIGNRAALVAAALVACNPILVWYSQEAKAYALLVFLGALTVLLFVRARERPVAGRVAAWGVACVLALLAHYFAVFLVAPEALMLLAAMPGRRRAAIIVCCGVAAVGLALVPLALYQVSPGWIAAMPLAERVETVVRELASANVLTTRSYAPPRNGLFETAFLVVVWAPTLLLLRRLDRAERAGAVIAGSLGAAAVLLPLALSLAGLDFFFDRNLIAAWIPLAIALGAVLGARRARWWGTGVAGLLCLGGVAANLEVIARPSLHRDDWRAGSRALGQPVGPRAVVMYPRYLQTPLRVYGQRLDEFPLRTVRLREVDLVDGVWPLRLSAPPGFRLAERRRLGRLTVRRFTATSPVRVTRDGLERGVSTPSSVPAGQRKLERGQRAAVAYQPGP